MATTVPFVELPGSGIHQYDAEGGWAQRLLLCDYSQADSLCAELLGFPTPAGTEHQRRRPPERHPARPYLYCRSCRYEGHGAPGREADGDITYTKAKVIAEYRPLERADSDDPDRQAITYMTERREIARHYERVPTDQLKWQEGPSVGLSLSDRSDLLKWISTLIVRVDVHYWFGAPVSSGVFEQTIGKVNAGDFRVLWTTWPAETLIYEGASLERQYTSSGSAAWKVGLQFRYRTASWNRFLHPSLTFYTVATSIGRKPYEPADFTLLIP